MRFNEVVAASPRVAAAALCLVTGLIPFNNTSGPLLDPTGSEPCVRPGVRRPPLAHTHGPRADTDPVAARPGRGRHRCRVSGTALGYRSRGGTGRGSPGGGRAASPVVRPRGASPWRWHSGVWRVAVIALRPLGGPESPRSAGAGAGLPVARPRRFRFHPGCWLLFNVPTHVSVCLVNRSRRESQAAVLSPLGKATILPAQHMV